jgi:hypothetical protein
VWTTGVSQGVSIKIIINPRSWVVAYLPPLSLRHFMLQSFGSWTSVLWGDHVCCDHPSKDQYTTYTVLWMTICQFFWETCDWHVKSEQTAFCLLLLPSQFHLPTWLSLFIGPHHPLVASEKLLFGWLNFKVQKQLMDSSNAYKSSNCFASPKATHGF